jgi:hypothetical protein
VRVWRVILQLQGEEAEARRGERWGPTATLEEHIIKLREDYDTILSHMHDNDLYIYVFEPHPFAQTFVMKARKTLIKGKRINKKCGKKRIRLTNLWLFEWQIL